MYLDRKFGPRFSLSEITFLFDLSLDLDQTLAQQKAERQAKSKVSDPLAVKIISKMTVSLLSMVMNLIQLNSAVLARALQAF